MRFLDGEAETPTTSEVPSTSNTISNIYFTSYNPEAGQTDSTPCIAGGTSMDLCELANQGIRTIALSQELIAWSIHGDETDLKAGQKVILTSTDFPDDPRCNGEFIVADAMNARFRDRGDIFFLSRSDNISCHANISY